MDTDPADVRSPPLGSKVPLEPGVVAPEVLARALDTVLCSRRLRGAAQLRRFLQFIVDESMAGRGDSLKAYTIATAAFGRPADFDGSQDPIVRVEATRLRAALTEFYAEEGRDAPVRIVLVPGTYRPHVQTTLPAPAAVPPAVASPERRAWSRRRMVLWAAGAALAINIVVAIGLGVAMHVLLDVVDSHHAEERAADRATDGHTQN